MQSGSDLTHGKPSTRKARATFSGNENELVPILAALSHKIGHEIGNPLTSIISLATIVERFSDSGADKNQQYARSIISEAWKISALVEKFVLLFSERDGSPMLCPLDEVIRRSLNKLKSRGGVDLDGLVLRVDDSTPPNAFADLDQLCTAVAELLVNASTAITDDKRQVSDNAVDERVVGEDLIVVRLFSVGGCGCIEIINPVTSPSSHQLEHLLKPLVTTSPTQKNLGIGLAVVSKVAKRFGGFCEIEERVAENGELHFVSRIVLPKDETAKVDDWNQREAQISSETPSAADAAATDTIRVLVVEDQEAVASAIRKILQFAFKGKRELICDCLAGAEALQRIEQGEQFDVILCDLNLSSMSGRKVFQSIQQQKPEMKSSFAYMTAEAKPDIEQDIPCLRKPFEPEELIQLVMQLLGRK